MAVLSIQNISKSYEGSSVLKELSLDIDRGDIMLIDGDNGTGKSTLFNLITGVESPDSGCIYLRGNDITTRNTLTTSRLGLICLYQQPRLFKNLKVLDNVICAAPSEEDFSFFGQLFFAKKMKSKSAKNKTKALKILKEFNLAGLQNEIAGNLSYGQQKLIAFSMIGMTNADLILLDEPFAGLNPIMIAEVKKIIQHFQKEGKTIIIIEHNIEEAIKVCNKHLSLREGKLYENKR